MICECITRICKALVAVTIHCIAFPAFGSISKLTNLDPLKSIYHPRSGVRNYCRERETFTGPAQLYVWGRPRVGSPNKFSSPGSCFSFFHNSHKHHLFSISFLNLTAVLWCYLWDISAHCNISMAYCTTTASALLMHWRYCSLPLSHRCLYYWNRFEAMQVLLLFRILCFVHFWSDQTMNLDLSASMKHQLVLPSMTWACHNTP